MTMYTSNEKSKFESPWDHFTKTTRSHSSQGLGSIVSSPAMKIPLPPRLWITDIEDESSEGNESNNSRDDLNTERVRVRSRFRHYKQRSSVPIGIFWDIENCQVPRGCSAIDVVAAIRAKFLTGRREADFVVVCDVRKEAANRLQELNDAQISLIHVCGTQKNAADEKLRQCMRRFGELHSAPAALLLISGDINFAADLSDFRHRKNMEVILVHKQNTSSALIACASSHYSYNDITAHLPRNPKTLSQTEEEEPTCEMEVSNLPLDQPPERVSRRLRRLADNCGGKVVRVNANTAMLRFPTPDHASRALKRMDGEDVFGRKISTRYARGTFQPAYSSDEGYSTAPPEMPPRPQFAASHQQSESPRQMDLSSDPTGGPGPGSVALSDWALALQQLPAPTPPPLEHCPPPAPRLRKIRGTHGSSNLDRSGCSSSNSVDEGRNALGSALEPARAMSPWNCSASVSEHSEIDESPADLTVTNLPPYDIDTLQEKLTQLFSQFVPVVRVTVWAATEGPVANVSLRSEWDARLCIARLHKRRLDSKWNGRRLELALGKPSPAPNLDALRARLRAILLEQPNNALPLVRLRDAYAGRHCCALTTSDLARVRDTVVVHEGFGRMVQLVDLTPMTHEELEEAPWKCHVHSGLASSHDDEPRILQPVYMEISALAKNVHALLSNHGGMMPLLSFVECYEATFPPLVADNVHGVALELLLRSVPNVEVKDIPSRHLVFCTERVESPPGPSHLSESSRSSGDRDRPRTAPALEPMLALFERELTDLLKSSPRCCIAFSKLIPAFHHHFGRQCRVADYGFTKLPDLLAALGNAIVVLGSGSSRVITISAASQSRRWTSDLVKILKSQLGRSIMPHDIPHLYQTTFGRAFSPVDYGVCTMAELMLKVNPQCIVQGADGSISLPRRIPTSEERARTVEFAMQAVELLCYTANLRMEFSRFVAAYRAHFGLQLRVAHYGCVKLIELFELIPEAVVVGYEHNGEKNVRLAKKTARAVMSQRMQVLAPISLSVLSGAYAAQYGAAPQPDILDVTSLEALVYASGASIDTAGIVRSPSDSQQWGAAVLAACAVLAADKSVARGSTQEYFESAFRHLHGMQASLRNLVAAGVVEVCDRRVSLTTEWRGVWRIATILAEYSPLLPAHLMDMYKRRYDTNFCSDMGVEDIKEFLSSHACVFAACDDVAANAFRTTGESAWRLNAVYPRGALPPAGAAPADDYSIYDTPPGQKGSRVFDSPQTKVWCSPPASALPTPTALLAHDSKRRTRLAAQFGI